MLELGLSNKVRVMQKKTYDKGSIIFNQNENSNEIYILNQGVLEIIVNKRRIAEISQRGVFFGEMAYILNEKRNATIRTKTKCSCLVIYSKYVEAVVKSSPEIGINLMKSLANRLKKTTANLLIQLNKTDPNPDYSYATDNVTSIPNVFFKVNSYYDCLEMLNIISRDKIKEFINKHKENKKKINFFQEISKFSGVEINDLTLAYKLYQKYKNNKPATQL